MIGLTFQQLWARKRRVLGAGIAVVLGVAFLFATLAVGDTLRAGFDTLYDDANAGIDVTVRSDRVIGTDEIRRRGTLDAGLADRLAAVQGVDAVVPVIDGRAQIVGSDGADIGGNGPPTLAANWIDDAATGTRVNPFQLVEGRAPTRAAAGRPVEVVIDRGSARNGDLAVGDVTVVKLPTPEPVVVVGIAAFGSLDSMGPSTWVAFDDVTAQELLLGPALSAPQVSSFSVVAQTGSDEAAIRQAMSSVVPDGVEVLTAAQLTAEQVAEVESDFLGFVQVFLTAFAGVALLVATFSIYNTFTILVAQRVRESALLRAIGASRRQILTASITEAAAIGVVASTVGLAVGWGIGVGLRALLAGGGIDLPGSRLVVTSGAVIVALACGVVVTLVASVIPAVKASRVAPIAAMRDAEIDRSSVSKARALFGVAMVGGGIAAALTATNSSDQAFTRAGLGAMLVVIGTIVLGPVVTRPTLAVLGAPVRALRGESGRIASRNATRNPTRTSATASALMVGSAVVVLFTVLGASITTSIRETVDRTFGGDLVVLQDAFSGAAIAPAFAGAIEQLDEVEVAAGMAFGPARIGAGDVELTAVDPARFAAILDLGVVDGSVENLRPGELATSVDIAEERRWAMGDLVDIGFADGSSRQFVVAAQYEEFDIAGDLVVNIADVPRRAGFEGDFGVLVDLADGVGLAAGAAAVDEVGAELGAPDAQTRDEYMDTVVGEIQTLLGIVYGLLALAVLIALMGIANTLSLSIHERRRELGLLRAIGQTRSELRSSVRWESMLIAVFGTLGGVGLGAFLGWTLVRAVAVQEGLGSFTLPVVPLAVILLVGAAAGTLAAARPARRAARLDVISALAAT